MIQKKLYIILMFFSICSIARGQTDAVYWFDSDYTSHVSTPVVGSLTVDASVLSPGVHTLHFLYMDNISGVPSSTYSKSFLVTEPQAKATKSEYWFDNNYVGRKSLALSSEAASIDLSGLTPGLHTIRYHALDAAGLPSSTYSSLFWIGAVAMKYRYWVNNLAEQSKTVFLETTARNFKHTLQIDVPEIPIRTEKYHFEMLEDQPKLYAKNTLTIISENADGTNTRQEEDYVDYRVSEDIEAMLLKRGDKKTVDKSDGIMWFKVEANEGDMLSFKLSRLCTVHLFSSSNKELWTASGDEVLLTNGTKADIDGSFYLAVQDLADADAKDITVEYYWNPKGDANCDKVTDEKDRDAIVSHIMGKNPEVFDETAADINNDNKVNAADVVELNNLLNE